MDDNIPAWIKDNLPTDLYNSQLFKFTVSLRVEDEEDKPKKITVNILPVLDVDYETLETEIANVPAQFAYFATVYSEARHQVNLYERAIKVRKGQLMKQILLKQQEAKTRLTSDQITKILDSDEGIEQLETKLANKQMQAGKLYYFLEALKMKNDNLRSLAGFKKQEQNFER